MSELRVEEALHWELVALQRRRTLLPATVPVAVITLLLGLLMSDCWGVRLGEWWRGERTWTGERRYVPAVTPNPDALASIDWGLLHERLLPRWGLSLGWGRSPAKEHALFAAALAETSPDPNLVSLLTGLRDVARTAPTGQRQRIEYLAWAWNEYLGRSGVPWYLDWNGLVGSGSSGLVIQTYAIRARSTFRVGDRTYPLLVLERADHLNVDDAALGRTGVRDGAAQVLVGAVRDHAELRVWPLLHELSSHATHTDGQFASAVSAEVRTALSPEHFAVLARTAPSFRALLLMRDAVGERRDCGSRFRLRRPPIRGYPATFRAELMRLAERTNDWPCPPVTVDEAAAIDLESEVLARESELAPALAELTAHLIRGVAVHEARHVADGDPSEVFRQPLGCPACRDGLSIAARAEVSAYLASFADEATGVSSLHQACRVSTGGSANAIALGYLLSQLVPGGCAAGPPPDLQTRARRLERALFKRSQRITFAPTPRRLADDIGWVEP
ncbi:MAG: hypothetical protein JW940_22990 [Polyangiaceae bacterium]|nr:hypothetical protein [Polyangiaceae bacterium]